MNRLLTAMFFLLLFFSSASMPPGLARPNPPEPGFQRIYPVRSHHPLRSRAYLARNVGGPESVQSLQVILDRLLSANHVPAEIVPTLEVQRSSTLNAATDGKKLLITSGLLSRLNDDDERAFVISHELAHILLQHISKTQARRIGLSLLDMFIVRRYTAEGSIVQMASELGIGLVDKRSSRGFEYQADDLGVRLMRQAGYNPQAAIRVFDTLSRATAGNRTPEFLQDHPITESRIRALVQKYKLSVQ